MALPSVEDFTRSQFTTAPVTVSLSNVTARSALLDPGMYLLYCPVAAFVLQGGSGVNATTSSIPLAAGAYLGPMLVTGAGDGYVAGILSSSTSTLYLIPVK